MKKRHLFLASFLMLASFHVNAIHDGSIKGIVVSADDNELLASVLVQIKMHGPVASTNEIGGFYFTDIPNGEYTLTFSIIGFQTQTILAKVTGHG